ncbi:MAG TPA: hypothetical protein VFT27_10840 [Actinomycetota bacterium]|nr:hypothetical protein [Actinomycetota bacterium]
MVYVLILVVLALVVLAPIWLWARVIEKRIEPPPDRPGHEAERFHFKYGGEPPSQGGIGGTISGAS